MFVMAVTSGVTMFVMAVTWGSYFSLLDTLLPIIWPHKGQTMLHLLWWLKTMTSRYQTESYSGKIWQGVCRFACDCRVCELIYRCAWWRHINVPSLRPDIRSAPAYFVPCTETIWHLPKKPIRKVPLFTINTRQCICGTFHWRPWVIKPFYVSATF